MVRKGERFNLYPLLPDTMGGQGAQPVWLVTMVRVWRDDPTARGGDLVPTMPVCVCQKVKDMGPFSASSE